MTHYYLLSAINLYRLEKNGSLWGWSVETSTWQETYFVCSPSEMSRIGEEVSPISMRDHPAFRKETFYRDVLSESKSE